MLFKFNVLNSDKIVDIYSQKQQNHTIKRLNHISDDLILVLDYFINYQQFIKNKDTKIMNQFQSDHFQDISLLHEDKQIPALQLSGDQQISSSIEPDKQSTQSKATFFLTIMIIMKSILGVSTLGLPSVFANLGIVFGIILLTVATILNHYSCVLLIKCKNLSHKSNLSTIGEYLVKGKIFLSFIYIILIFNSFGICTAEITTFKQIIQAFTEIRLGVNKSQWYIQSWFTIGICLGLLIAPLVLMKKVQKLRYFSLIGVSAILLLVLTIFINFFVLLSENKGKMPSGISASPSSDGWGSVASIPNILLALIYQMNFFPIYKGMEETNDKKILKASVIGNIGCYIVYLSVGLLGYLTYGGLLKNQTNFLLVLNSTIDSDRNLIKRTPDGLYFLMNGLLILSVSCTIPVMFFAGRNGFIALINLFLRHQDKIIFNQKIINSETIQDQEQKKKILKYKRNNILFYGLTLLLYLIVFIIAITIGSLGKIINIVGSISANTIGYILPELFYVLLIYRFKRIKKYDFYISILVFSIAIPFGIITIVAEYIK